MEKYAEQTKQEFEGWDEFISKPVDEKLEAFKQNGRIFDVIYAQQFDREFLDSLCNLADMIRLLAKPKWDRANSDTSYPTSGPCFILFSLPRELFCLFKMPVTF